jgi:hypothetical protein
MELGMEESRKKEREGERERGEKVREYVAGKAL